jgi:hypothetical protein
MNLIDYLLNLFRSPNVDDARAFVHNPVQAASTATGQAVTATQLQTAYTAVAPASAAYGGGDPIVGMQRAVANHNNLEFEPNRVLSPDTEIASRNNAEFLSNNDPQVLSPNAGESVQQGGINLDFSDMTFGDRNEASDGSVINTGTAGDIDATNVKGDGNVVGDNNDNVSTGDIEDSNVNIGDGNEIDDSGDITAGGDVIKDNEGPVLNDVDTSGGNGGNASGGDGGGGGLLGGIGNDGGNGGNAGGGSGGGIVINDNDTTTVGGNQNNVEVDGDVSGGGAFNMSDNSGQDHSDHSVNDSYNQDNDQDNRDYSQTNSNNETDHNNVETDVSIF